MEVVREMQTTTTQLRNAQMNAEEIHLSSMLVATDPNANGLAGHTTHPKAAFLSMIMEPAVQHPSHVHPKDLQIPISAITVVRTMP